MSRESKGFYYIKGNSINHVYKDNNRLMYAGKVVIGDGFVLEVKNENEKVKPIYIYLRDELVNETIENHFKTDDDVSLYLYKKLNQNNEGTINQDKLKKIEEIIAYLERHKYIIRIPILEKIAANKPAQIQPELIPVFRESLIKTYYRLSHDPGDDGKLSYVMTFTRGYDEKNNDNHEFNVTLTHNDYLFFMALKESSLLKAYQTYIYLIKNFTKLNLRESAIEGKFYTLLKKHHEFYEIVQNDLEWRRN